MNMMNPKSLLCMSVLWFLMWMLFLLCAGKPNGVPMHVAWLPCYHHNVCCYWGSCSQDASWVSCGLAKGAFAFSEVQVAAKYTQSLSGSRLSRNSSRGNGVQGRLIVRRPLNINYAWLRLSHGEHRWSDGFQKSA